MEKELKELQEEYINKLNYSDTYPIQKSKKLALRYAFDVLKKYTKSQIKQGEGNVIDYLSSRLELEPDIELCLHFPLAKIGGMYRIKEYPNIYISQKSIAYKYELLTIFEEEPDCESVFKCLTDLHHNAQKVIDASFSELESKLKLKIKKIDALKKADQLNETIAVTVLEKLIPKNIVHTWARYHHELKLFLGQAEISRWGNKRPADLVIDLNNFNNEWDNYKNEVIKLVAQRKIGA